MKGHHYSKVFISYRRDDSAYIAAAIRDDLERRLGTGSVFFDTDSIGPGEDFDDRLKSSLAQTKVLLAIIGDRWNPIRSGGGVPALDNPRDYVRMEIEQAMERGITVVPVLVGKATMPPERDIPASIERLSRCQATEIRAGADLRTHLSRLTESVRSILKRENAQAVVSKPMPRHLLMLAAFALVAFALLYPFCLHDRLTLNSAVRVTKTVNLRPGPGTNFMPGTIVVTTGQPATYVERTFRKYHIDRDQGGEYLDYWRKIRTSNNQEGWVYGAYLEALK